MEANLRGATSAAEQASSHSAMSAIRDLLAKILERSPDIHTTIEQQVLIANFPPHYVRRLDDGEWLIFNDNVAFVSCAGEEPGSYDERGFLTVTPQQRAEATAVSELS